jgi:hypothetical protein
VNGGQLYERMQTVGVTCTYDPFRMAAITYEALGRQEVNLHQGGLSSDRPKS